ncbi:MAG: 2-amino-4-hydroxy-6-hydroxymethyldihydropteridine diphosphokinase [Phycisphaerales bacterium]
MSHPPEPSRCAYIALGSNLGDRASTIAAALRALDRVDGIRLLQTSTLIETDPVGPVGQGPYLNGVVSVATSLDPRGLLNVLLAIEQSLGRERTTEERWGARTIDLDLVLFADTILDEPGLTVPHPRLHERRFVLQPLVEIAPDARHPSMNVTAVELLDRLDTALSDAATPDS